MAIKSDHPPREELDETVHQQAEQNDPLSQFEMGYRTERTLRDVMNANITLYHNYETAMQWYRRSVESGYEPARNRMETLHERWQDRAKLMKRAEEGDGRAFYDLGKLVVSELEQLFDDSNKGSARFEDVDSEELYFEAESWFERAAGEGDARARTALQELERDWYIEACQPLLNIKLPGCWS